MQGCYPLTLRAVFIPFVPAHAPSQSSRQRSCEGASHTVPSPHVGEGQGGGWRRRTAREPAFSAQFPEIRSLGAGFCPASDWKQPLCSLYPPPCPSPTWGEGTLWHRSSTPLTLHSRSCQNMCACVSACAGTNGGPISPKMTRRPAAARCRPTAV